MVTDAIVYWVSKRTNFLSFSALATTTSGAYVRPKPSTAAAASTMPLSDFKRPVTSMDSWAALFRSDLEYTILHPANLMQNLAGAWHAVLEGGVFAEPFPVET